MSSRRDFSIADGTEQADRFPRALEPGYFQPDERSFDQLLALGADLARTLAFYDLSDRRKGSWGDLFAADEAVVMARILSTDPDRLGSEFARLGDKGLEHGVRFAFATARTIDHWVAALDAAPSRMAAELRERIQPLLSAGLSRDLGRLARIIDRLRPEMPSLEELSFDGFHRLWGIRRTAAEAPAQDPEQSLRGAVRAIVASFLNVIAQLRTLVRPRLAESLRSRQHEPAIALFLVFLKLFEQARGPLNRFTGEHLDFYYSRVLGARALPHRPDRLFFVLRPGGGKSGVPFPAGTELVARPREDRGEVVFVSEGDALVSDARVETLCTLRFERDRFISPETELGYVTRVKALRRDQGAAEEPAAALSAWPVFGTSSRLAGHKGAQDARIGFAAASPILLLAEGRRTVEVEVEFGDPGESAGAEGYDRFRRDLREMVTRPGGREPAFRRLLGRIFRHYLLADEVMDPAFRRELDTGAGQWLSPHARSVVEGLLRMGPEAAFQRLLKEAFAISLTTPSGWHAIDRFVVTRTGSKANRPGRGLRFRFTLGREVEPIVPHAASIHGGQPGETEPLIRFQLNPQAGFCACSLFDALPLEAIAIEVHVQGLRALKLYNNVGRIDPSKPFQPFGPLPSLSSYFALGCYEMAQKRLTELTLNLEWADLPAGFGGFAPHYAGYGRDLSEEDFRVDVSVLRDGTWRPKREGQRPLIPLFRPTGPADRLDPRSSVRIEALDHFRPLDSAVDESGFDLQAGTGNGFIRLGLKRPEGAFGHADYPVLLSRALAENIRSKKPSGKVPNAPYTPLISDLSVDYRARTRIRVDETGNPKRSETRQRIFHLHPFGVEEIRSLRVGNPYALLPKYATDGNLFIGVGGGGAGQALSLFFDLQGESNQQTAFQSPAVSWYYLSPRGWRRMPAMNIVQDGTRGFTCAGIVTLVLPPDLDRESTLMPAGKAWIRAGASERLDSLPRLRSVHTNAIRAGRRIDGAGGGAGIEPLPPGCRWRTAVSVPGIAEVVQAGASHGGLPAEDRRRFLTRMSERLCHKGRAVNSWDYERLVLENFPDVFKVKCFEGLVPAVFDPDAAAPEPRPGCVLVVVVPAAGEGGGLKHSRPMLDLRQLTRIRRFLQRVSSPFVELEVRNPLYERIQVRCKARFTDDTNSGFRIRQLNEDVSAFLCPWIASGYRARFGWMISREEVEGFIRSRDYVDYVTDFSMLHIVEDDEDLFTLADTVSRGEIPRRQRNRVRWRYPWSLAVPMERHFIEALQGAEPIEPEPAGIGELDIGGTFIISGNH